MENETIFKTKSGFCHILPDKIIFSRDGIIGNISKITVGNNISRLLIIYSGISIYLIYQAYQYYLLSQIFSMILLILLAILLIYSIIVSLNYSATPIIYRDKIKSIIFKKANFGITRSRFEVTFENEQGKFKKRLILLPGSLNQGEAETAKAVEILKREQLLI